MLITVIFEPFALCLSHPFVSFSDILFFLLFFPLASFCLYLSLLISLALHLSCHHSLLFSLSVGDGVKCSCRPNSLVIGSHLLLPPQCIWNHWLQTSQSKSKSSYKGDAFRRKVVWGWRFTCILAVWSKLTYMYTRVADLRITPPPAPTNNL